MTTPSTPRKRQNTTQPAITTFFNPCSAPKPPPSVQSKLLNVGMRVRKSVPEGYKSGTYKFNKFPVSKASTPIFFKSASSDAPNSPSKKREYEAYGNAGPEEVSAAAEVEVVMGGERQIAVPKSQRRKYHAAIARGNGDVVMMVDEDDFEEATFLKGVDERAQR